MLTVAHVVPNKNDLEGRGGPTISGKMLQDATKHRLHWVEWKSHFSVKAMDACVSYGQDAWGKISAPRLIHVVCDVIDANAPIIVKQPHNMLVAVSDHAYQNLKKITSKVELIENVARPNFTPGMKDPSLARDYPVLIYCGNLSASKGVNKLIDAVKNLPCELWLIGFGNRIKPINNVKFLGIRKEAEVINYLRSADAFVFPSDSEGMSLSLLEAMAVGLPCIVSDIPANRDTCKNTALYVDRTVDSIRQGICQLLESKQLQNDLSVSALELSKTRTYVNWGNHFADVIEEMVCKL